MKAKSENRRRIELRRSDKIVLCIVALLVAIIVVLSILQRCGLSLINGMLMIQLPFLALAVLVGWGGYVLIRRISKRMVKLIASVVVALIYGLVLVIVFTYISFVGSVTFPQRYATLTSPSGARKLVVISTIDLDEERIETRRTARLAANPDDDPEVGIRDWGIICRAYPSVWNVFYRSNADVEGEIYLVYDASRLMATEQAASEGEEGSADAAEPLPCGTMMIEWLDDENVAHFFVDQPGAAEGGECTVRF